MHTLVALGLVTLQWCVVGDSLAFGGDVGGMVGGLEPVFLGGVGLEPRTGMTVPHHALRGVSEDIRRAHTGARVGGVRGANELPGVPAVRADLEHAGLRLAGAVGLGGGLGVLDFAAGLVVHVSSGLSALACAAVIGARIGYPREKTPRTASP